MHGNKFPNIRGLFRHFWKIQQNFLGRSPDREETRRVYLLYFLSVIAIAALIFFGILSLLHDNTPLGIFDFFLAFILIANVLHARRYKRYRFNIYSGIFLTAMLLIYMFFTGGVQKNGGFVWYYTFPLVSAFLLGSKKGAIASALILLPAIGLFLVKSPPESLVSYPFELKLRFLSSFLLVSLCSYLFEYSRERNREELRGSYTELERRVEERTSALQEAVQKLEVEISERRRVEEALRESESKFQQLFDDAPVGYHEYGFEGRITRVNRTELEMTGYASEEMIGQFVWTFTHEEQVSRETVLGKLAGRIPPGRDFERTYRRKDGSTFPVTIQDRPRKDNQGRIIGILSTIQDITDRKKSEEILKEYQKVIESSQDIMVVINRDYKYLLANKAFLKYRNVDRAQVIGRSVSEVMGKDIFDKTIKKNLDACFLGSSIQYESKHTYPELGERDIFVSYFPIEGPHRIERVASVVRDITERKRAEERLRESEERFRQLAENIREVFYIYEQDVGRISYISPAYREIWGRTPQSLYERPQSFSESVHPEDRNRVMKSHERKSRGEVEEVYRIVRPDGSTRWVKDRSFPVYHPSGKTTRVVGIAADITELKLGEEKLKYLSLHDSLTGLYNRIFFEEEMLRIEKGRSERVGVLSCDVDGLKLVNDTLGHDHGDLLLIAAARALQETFREGDLVARIGGDEFAVVLPDTTETAVRNACQRIQESVERYNETHSEFRLSISVGYSLRKERHQSLKDVFEEADNQMYRKKLYRTQSIRSTLLKTLIQALNARDLANEKHAIRLERLLVGMATRIGLPESAASDLSLLSKFHDIGKVGIPDALLFKEGPLTVEEWTEMKRHSEIGYRIALSAPDLVPIADWILKHHEWWNGQGYPLGIRGEEIPIQCRLLAIVEAYEVMTNPRPYRRVFSHAEAVAELLNHAGTQFDPQLLHIFLQMLENDPLGSQSGTASSL